MMYNDTLWHEAILHHNIVYEFKLGLTFLK